MAKSLRQTVRVIFLVLLMGLLSGAYALADSAPLELAPGVTYSSFDVPTGAGVAVAHMVTVDLTQPGVSLNLLYPGVVGRALPLSTMVADQGAIAGVNADFFNISATQPGITPTNAPVGPMILAGKVLKAAVPTVHRFGPSLPSGAAVTDVVGVGIDGVVRIGRLTLVGTISTPQGNYTLRGLNQYGIAQGGIALFNSDWGSVSRKRSICGDDSKRENPCSTNTYEVIVKDGKVAAVAEEPGAGAIPEDTFVLVGREAGADQLRALKIGDPVTVEYQMLSSLNVPFDFAVGCQPLIRDGKAVPGLNATTYAIRSAIGISQDGKTVYLIALDRNKGTMTYAEIAKMLLSVGAYTGANLDGGGSSTLVIREPGVGGEIVVKNIAPTDAQRPIPNGIGVFYTAP
ncbi:MAG: phosphodiester glycosidase family protein [Limnochordia bacterium]|jgi:hypothetical protein